MWGGRFDQPPSELFREANDSLPFDWTLVQQDITGSIAWAEALQACGVLSAGEARELTEALASLDREAALLKSPPTDSGAEDVHTWVEQRLIEQLGDLGKKLHTGRSRNDQVATDLRLWCRQAIDERLVEVRGLLGSLLAFADRTIDVIIPGYTHLQRAQPVLMAHWAMSYASMLQRDAARLADARRRVNRCPLGSAALAGTAYAIDREQIARSLGFDAPTDNSLDAVSDRDFVVETLAALSITATHLSRMGEELLLYGSSEFGFVTFDDSVASGSSIMPQKKNPDAAELMRGKAGRVIGHLTGMLVTVKGLPLAYNKDLQEDKEPLFDAMRQLSMALRLASATMDGTAVNEPRCRQAAAGSYTNATELADYLVGKGVAFRDAHHQVGRIVAEAAEAGTPLEDIPLDQLRAHAPAVEEDVFGSLTLEAAIGRRDVPGGTARARVLAQMDGLRAWLTAGPGEDAQPARHR